MWIMTTIGFYSAVQHRDNHDDLLIRARSKADLERLQQLAVDGYGVTVPVGGHAPGLGPIDTTLTRADYPHRMVISKAAWKAILEQLTDDVDYDNFKTAVAKAGHPERANTYHNVWQTLLAIEREPDAGVYPKGTKKPAAPKPIAAWRQAEIDALDDMLTAPPNAYETKAADKPKKPRPAKPRLDTAAAVIAWIRS